MDLCRATLLLVAALSPVTAYAEDPTLKPDTLMDSIEAVVKLPPRAHGLNEYGRYYALAGPDQVEAVYLIPYARQKPDLVCERMHDANAKPCAHPTITKAPEQFEDQGSRQVAAGRRRWVRDKQALPHVFDGGCSVVTIDYVISSKSVASVRCNGVA